MQIILIKKLLQSPDAAPKQKQHAPISWAVNPVGLGQSALLVLLPMLVEATGIGYSQWAQLFAVGMGTYLIGTLLWPQLLPRLGYRAALMLSLGGYGISMALFGVIAWLAATAAITPASAVVALMASRALYGASASGLLPIAQSWSSEHCPPDERLRAFSQISLQLALSRALGPVLAIAMMWVHWVLVPAALALWAWALLWGYRHLPDDQGHRESAAAQPSWRHLWPPMWLGMVAMSTTAMASSIQFQLSPALAAFSQWEGEQLSGLVSILLVAVAALSVLAHRLQLKYPPAHSEARQIAIAVLLTSCALGILASTALWQFITMALIMGVGMAWLTPLYSTALSQRAASPHSVAAQLGLAHIAGHLLGLTMTAIALEHSLHSGFIWLATLGAVTTVATLSTCSPRKK